MMYLSKIAADRHACSHFAQDYRSSIAQLEGQCDIGIVTLQRMVFLLQPALEQMAKLADIAISIDKGHCVGGAVLSLLHERTLSSIG